MGIRDFTLRCLQPFSHCTFAIMIFHIHGLQPFPPSCQGSPHSWRSIAPSLGTLPFSQSHPCGELVLCAWDDMPLQAEPLQRDVNFRWNTHFETEWLFILSKKWGLLIAKRVQYRCMLFTCSIAYSILLANRADLLGKEPPFTNASLCAGKWHFTNLLKTFWTLLRRVWNPLASRITLSMKQRVYRGSQSCQHCRVWKLFDFATTTTRLMFLLFYAWSHCTSYPWSSL